MLTADSKTRHQRKYRPIYMELDLVWTQREKIHERKFSKWIFFKSFKLNSLSKKIRPSQKMSTRVLQG